MKTATIGKRIAVGFASVILISLALGIFGYTRLLDITEHSDRITKFSLPTTELVSRAQKNAKNADRLIYKHIGSSDKEDMARLETELSSDSAANAKIYEQLSLLITDEKGRAELEKTKTARAEFRRIREEVLASSRTAADNLATYAMARKQMDPLSDSYQAALSSLIDCIRSDAEDASKNIQFSVNASKMGILIGLVLASVVGISVAFFIIRGLSKTLNQVATVLDAGSDQVASAAGQISSTSQTLAEGSSEQAASLEETSSSLEEISSLTKNNAKGAGKAKELANQARQAADIGATDMEHMSVAMSAIKASSNDIAKIIKTIDEIAFQTNILALNAAVEAARAGEAGMGFAVVAEEVRNLAQRSALAAKETAAKIEGAVSNAEQGVQISTKVAANLQEIVNKVRQVDELISEVAGASREQSQGIDQVAGAVTQMDKVTQANAANAEESASASEELNAQAHSLKAAVGQLLDLVGTSHTAMSSESVSLPTRTPTTVSMPIRQRTQISRRTGVTRRASTPSLGNADAQIPMNDFVNA